MELWKGVPWVVRSDELFLLRVICGFGVAARSTPTRSPSFPCPSSDVQGQHAPADEAMAKVFVWLRYSSIRQLTWQRNYNTQPRILGAAQERLTHAAAAAHAALDGPAREWARLCLTCVGRGGNAQAVRDEILAIMHRNKISEVKGTWMEEFHQKLHNK